MNSGFEILFGLLLVIGLLFLVGVVIFVIFKAISKLNLDIHIETPEKRAGRQGERFATQIISEILKDGDVCFTNVKINADGKQAELDNLVINNRGAFIIEVKNYVGEVYGTEEDPEWIKNKISPGGYFSQVTIKNPIKQVKRQTYILSKYLKEYGFDVWVEGYVFFVNMNSPIDSQYVLPTRRDIDNAIHYGYNNNLRNDVKDRLVELFDGEF